MGKSQIVKEEERFWAKVDTSGSCWLWRGHRLPTGYGQFFGGGKVVFAHRWAYAHIRGAIPAHLYIDHLCRNTSCIRPSHLEVVTNAENVRRAQLITRNNESCPKGHAWTIENTGVRLLPHRTDYGTRYCRMCSRARAKLQQKRQKQ